MLFFFYLEISEDQKTANRKKTASRAKREIRRIVNSNEENNDGNTVKFVTFTFAENITDFRSANYEWKKFRQRLEDRLKIKLKYLTVVEFQKRGAIHYHCVFFNMPYVDQKTLFSIWGQGFGKVNKIEEVNNIGAYVCKYIGKDLEEDRLIKEKCYFTSKGLLKPLELIEKEEIDQLLSDLPHEKKVYEKKYFDVHTGDVTYRQYNMKN